MHSKRREIILPTNIHNGSVAPALANHTMPDPVFDFSSPSLRKKVEDVRARRANDIRKSKEKLRKKRMKERAAVVIDADEATKKAPGRVDGKEAAKSPFGSWKCSMNSDAERFKAAPERFQPGTEKNA